MKQSWAATIPDESLSFAGRLRLEAIEVCIPPSQVSQPSQSSQIFLRGSGEIEDVQMKLSALPGLRLFKLTDNLITPVGAKVPVGRLPDGPWTRLSEALAVAAPTASLPGILEKKVRLSLVRSERQREANILVADADAWHEWGILAPAVRLKELTFALSEARALIWGDPLPAIPGERYVEENALAVPCGFELHPVSDAEIVRPLLRANAGDLAIFFADGTYDLIESSLFVAATRSAIRQSFSARGSNV